MGLTDGDTPTDEGGRSDSGKLERLARTLRIHSPKALDGTRTIRELGDYEVVAELGRGGMGVVFKARQKSLNRDVALKMILSGSFASTQEIERLREEAESAAHLDHPNIVPIYEIGESQGYHYFTMKYVEGESLQHRIKPLKEDHRSAVALVATIARAVHYAHQRGILHRDLKPGNILIDQSGIPYITDFGLAHRVTSPKEQTISGAVVGTPLYMAPEQALLSSGRLTTAADVYSLGAILYELLTGSPVFDGESLATILHQVVEVDPKPARSRVPGLSRDLDTICSKCLEKDPAKRYGSAEALAEDLEHWLHYEPIDARPAGKGELLLKWARRRPLDAALIAALVIVGIVAQVGITSLWKRSERKAEESRQRLVRLNVVNGTRLAQRGDLAGALLWYTEALDLDEHHSEEAKVHRIRIGSLLQQMPHLRTLWQHPDPVWYAEMSPGGSRLLTISGPDAKDNRFSNAVLRLWPSLSSPKPVWSTEFSGGRPPIYRIRYDSFSPEGQSVVTIRSSGDDSSGIVSEISVLKAATGVALYAPMSITGLVTHVSFDLQGHRLVAGGRSGVVHVWELAEDATCVGRFEHGAWVTVARISPDGRTLMTGGMDRRALLWDLQKGGKAVRILEHSKFLLDGRFDSDGSRLVTAASDHTGGTFHVWNVATGERICSMDEPRTSVEGVVYEVHFSPDDRYLLTARFDGTATLWDAQTGRQSLPHLQHEHGVLTAGFNRAGDQVITTSFDKTTRIWDLTTAGVLEATLNHLGFPLGAFFTQSPSEVLTFGTDHLVRRWRMPQQIERVITLTHSNEVLYAEFSPDGARVLTASADYTARVWTAIDGRPLTPPLVHEGAVLHASFSEDGGRVVTASADGTARVWTVGSPDEPPVVLRLSNTVWYASFDPAGVRVVTASGRIGELRSASSRVFRDFSSSFSNDGDDRGAACIWDVRTGELVCPPIQQAKAVLFAAFSRSGDSLVTSSADGSVVRWSLPECRRAAPVMGHEGLVFQTAFTPDGRWIATASGGAGTLENGTAQIWNAESGKLVGGSLPHADLVYSVAFSPDGQRVATGSEDGTARVWNRRTGAPLTPPIVNGNIVLGVSFSPDGRFLITSSLDGYARIWNALTGELVSRLRLHRERINLGVFDKSGSKILTASDDGTVRICPLPYADRSVEDLELMAQTAAARRIGDDGTELQPLDLLQFMEAWTNLCRKFPEEYSLIDVSSIAATHSQLSSSAITVKQTAAER